ncbi:zinc-ribbon domain-containing protein [uncultured Tyzzerella sp.]|uniref:zinc-ribbon domain-containing protein n=1 Tax=uncultured Tyzzerella sp. TaxID=2321398 RepID=UPI00294392A8|nr:zinc-ribbon domain-containing protein [uncultured Tyzzerella sp.]
MFCKNCGKDIPDNSVTCQNCGASVGNPIDTDNIGYFFLGCCIPVAGIILYFVWKDQKPKNAKKCIIGALVSIGAGVIFYLVYILLIVGIMLNFA